MFAKALFAFLVCPGIVAIAVPLAWLGFASRLRLAWPPGLLLLALGLVGLLWCVRDFYVSGKGTLAPWSPPTRLVTVGLYRYSRNPMYAAVTVMLAGWAASCGSFGLAVYALTIVLIFHLRVVLGEEPWLDRTFGEQWRAYANQVPRWLW